LFIFARSAPGFGCLSIAEVFLMITQITPDLVDEIVGYLDDPTDRRRVWRGLCFMEKMGLDWSLRSAELHAYLTDEDHSPLALYGGTDAQEEKAVVLALRQRARADLGLPPLSDQELRSWNYSMPADGEVEGSSGERQTWSETYHADHEERAKVRAEVARLDPELSRALVLFAAHNAQADGSAMLSTFWVRDSLKKLVRQIMPALSGLDTHQLVSDILNDE
jgi:hypothetical protein